jgi:hypothetical protein
LVFCSLIDLTTRNRRETEAETERIRSSQTAAERALEAREKAHRARVKSLEDQVNSYKIPYDIKLSDFNQQITTIKEQLHQEMRKRQSFLNRSLANGEEISALRREITDSLSFVSQDPHGLDPVLLDHETKRLADIHEPPVRHSSPTRRALSPSLALRTMRAAASSPSQLGSQSPGTRVRSSRPRY